VDWLITTTTFSTNTSPTSVLADLPSIEQLIRLDDEVANKVTMPRYEGPVDPIEWTFLENYYSGLFADFHY